MLSMCSMCFLKYNIDSFVKHNMQVVYITILLLLLLLFIYFYLVDFGCFFVNTVYISVF